MKNVTRSDVKSMFEGAKNRQEIKSVYKKLAFLTHPDRGGDEEMFKFVGLMYEKYFKTASFDKKHESANERPEEFVELINNLMKIFPNDMEIVVEIRGSWVWISKEDSRKMFPYKEDLKKLSFEWSSGNCQWYLADKNSRGNKKHYKYHKGAKDKFTCVEEKIKGNKVDTKELK